MGIIEKIKEMEAEMARNQKNKATDHHLGQLKAKIAKLRTQLLEPPKDFQEAASYEFTTLSWIPGIIHYNDTKIQLLDLLGIIEGASEGKGRGRQIPYLLGKNMLFVVCWFHASSEGHQQILTRELEAVGLCLTKRPPQIYFKKKKTGGISFNSTVPVTHVDEKRCYQILHEYKIHNAEVLFPEDATVDDLIDVNEAQLGQITCKDLGRNGASESLHKTTRIEVAAQLRTSVITYTGV